QLRLDREVEPHPAAGAATPRPAAQDQRQRGCAVAGVDRPRLLTRAAGEPLRTREPAIECAAQQRVESGLELDARVDRRQRLRASFAACLMLRASATRITSSAMFVAWSPTRSRCLATMIRSTSCDAAPG